MDKWVKANKWVLIAAIAIVLLLTASSIPSVAEVGFSGLAGHLFGVTAGTMAIVYALQRVGLVRNRAAPGDGQGKKKMPWDVDESD